MHNRNYVTGSAAVRACGAVLAAAALAWSGSAKAQPGPTVGLNQQVAVVVCKYRGNPDPALSDGTQMTAEVLSARFTERVNAYYANASARQATIPQLSFAFRPVPGICELGYAYDETAPGGAASLIPAGAPAGLASLENDPQVMMREVPDAIKFANGVNPALFDTARRVVVVVDRPKRARAAGSLPVLGLPGRPLTLVSVSLIDPSNVNEFTVLTPGQPVPTTDFRVLCHELGHHLGLPDLYREDAIHGPGRDFVENWCEMASQTGQHFSSYCRHKLGWVPALRIRDVQPDLSTGFVFDQTFQLGPAGSNVGEADMVRINTSLPGMPFSGYHVEVRSNGATGRVDANLPGNYEPGVLVTKISGVGDATVGMVERPVFVQSRGGTADSLRDATFRPGDAGFFDAETGVRVDVLGTNPPLNDNFRVRVRMSPPPRPDVLVADMVLDSPTNGGALAVPQLWGDAIDYSMVVQWQDNSPFPPTPILPPVVTAIDHQLRIALRNGGNAPATSVRATVVFARPQVPAAFALDNPATWSPVALDTRTVDFGMITPGQTATRTVTYAPQGPFAAAVFVDRADNELMIANNFTYESFLVQWLVFGSPYRPLELETKVINGNPQVQSVIVAPDSADGIPPGWTASMDKVAAMLGSGRAETFKLRVQPPDVASKPPTGTVKDINTVTLVTSMNLSDTWVPVYKQQVYAVLSRPTKLSLECGGKVGSKVSVNGRLTYTASPGSASNSGLASAPVAITVSGSDGAVIPLTVVTGSDGKFSVSVPDTRPGVQYVACGRYGGGAGYGPAESDGRALCVAAGKPDREPAEKVALKELRFGSLDASGGKRPTGVVVLSGPAPRGGVIVNLESSQPRTVIVPEAVRIPEGQTSSEFDIGLKLRRGAKPPRSVVISASYLSVTVREKYAP